MLSATAAHHQDFHNISLPRTSKVEHFEVEYQNLKGKMSNDKAQMPNQI
jgi:hypothetical protein